MLDRKALLAIVLSFLVLLAWYAWAPQPEVPPPAPAEVPSAPATPSEPGAVSPDEPGASASAKETASTGEETVEPIGASGEESLRVDTDLFEVDLTNRGGLVTSWRLKQYVSASGRPVELVPAFAKQGDLASFLAVEVTGDARLTTEIKGALFQVERSPLEASDGERVRFLWADRHGHRVVKTLSFRPRDYLVDVEVEASDRGRALPVRVAWGPGLEADDSVDGGYLHFVGQAVYKDAGGVTRKKKVDAETVVSTTDGLRWAGIEEQYFAALLLPSSGRGDVAIRPVTVPPHGKVTKPEEHLLVAVGADPYHAQLFVGPKKYTLLRELGHELDSVVWFSSYSLIAWMAKLLLLVLLWIHDHVVSNYGLAIIAATVMLRLLLFPLNQYSMIAMKRVQAQMQRIQPKVNGIKTKYRKNKDAESRRKMNEEMMALYRKEGVNPMGSMSGCLPLLIQFPILIGFYNMLTVAIELRGAPFFGWISDLTLKDPFYVTPVLMGATMFMQQKMTTTPGGDPAQRRVMLMMPIVFTVMFLNLPSGLVLYWFVNNLLGIAQQWLVNRHLGRVEAAAQKA